jgi:CheY-like chemotaxis protein
VSRNVIAIRGEQEAPKILVVDDQFENRDWLTKLLRAVGFTVRGADNGQAALEIWAEWKPALILMDLHMPVMDGLEATRTLKATPRGQETKVVMLSASAMDNDRRSATESGADGFVAKPCSQDELLETMRSLLQLAYHYEESPQIEGRGQEASAVSGEVLGRLPVEMVGALLDATLKGSKKLLDKLILEVRETENSASADALQELADQYEYDTLTRLLEEVCH